ncbi:MAG: N-acetylmuramoyl-L-alanine amidase [Chloroflexi bacterium]|nr:N-acetylmuramoyl-L-alanine amidase [Chloroflexota bacterium]
MAISPFTATSRPSWTPSPSPSPSFPPGPLIAIDAGHGGVDLGAVHLDDAGRLDLTESEVNLAIALELQTLLLERGYRVYMVRDGDYSLNEEEGRDVNDNGLVDFVDEAQARVDAVNKAGVDLLLSIHQNAFYRRDGSPAEDVGGTVTYYCADRPFSADSLRFAEQVQEKLVAALRELGHDVHDRGVQDDLVLQVPGEPGSHLILLGPQTERIVRPSEMPGVLSETLFITHRGEVALLKDGRALRRLALAYAEAIDAYFSTANDSS